MRLNTDSIEVEFNQDLHKWLVKLFKYSGKKKPRIESVIEVGTYLGTGTTKLIADAIIEAKRQNSILFYTIEVDYEKYKIAKRNLEKYSFIQSLHGLSLRLQECLDFISNDEAILHHENYPTLIIDSPTPEFFYRNEVYCSFTNPVKKPIEGILYDLIPQQKENNPLVVLDGCGGCGKLDFDKICQLMGNNHYYLFCDDRNHLKNFRTYEYVKKYSDQWKILFETDRIFLVEYLGE